MKKTLLIAVLAVLAIGLVAGSALAAGPTAPAGKSNVAHLYLYEKDSITWAIVEGGAWGKMTYGLAGPTFDFVFNGHGLEAGWDYTLIYYPDPWPGNGLICLAKGTANAGGNLNLKGAVAVGENLPATGDENYGEGAKIWLVPSADVDCANRVMAGWNPAEYLFEYNLITYTCAP